MISLSLSSLSLSLSFSLSLSVCLSLSHTHTVPQGPPSAAEDAPLGVAPTTGDASSEGGGQGGGESCSPTDGAQIKSNHAQIKQLLGACSSVAELLRLRPHVASFDPAHTHQALGTLRHLFEREKTKIRDEGEGFIKAVLERTAELVLPGPHTHTHTLTQSLTLSLAHTHTIGLTPSPSNSQPPQTLTGAVGALRGEQPGVNDQPEPEAGGASVRGGARYLSYLIYNSYRTCPVHYFGHAGTNPGGATGRDLLPLHRCDRGARITCPTSASLHGPALSVMFL